MGRTLLGRLGRLGKTYRKRSEGKGGGLIRDAFGMPYADLPSLLPLEGEACDRVLSEFRAATGVPDTLDPAISKNDLMFLFSLKHQTPAGALRDYLELGFHATRLISALATPAFGGLDRLGSFLDFASGYGRLTRFLVLELPADRIWVSDIKPQAVAFQSARFGVSPLGSSFVPEEFQPGRRFDFIFVASLFSHLPEELFSRWLASLYRLTTDAGLLAVSVCDRSLMNEKRRREATREDFVFVNRSEDKIFEVVSDTIREDDAYGLTYVSEDFMERTLRSLGIPPAQWCRYPHGLAGHQDLYVIARDPASLDRSLELPTPGR